MVSDIGIDIGSQSIYAVFHDGSGFSNHWTKKHHGDIPSAIRHFLHYISDCISKNKVRIGITGNVEHSDIFLIDPVLAAVEAAKKTGSIRRHILSVGCERSFIVNLDEKGCYKGHSAQSDCAAGTGGFIDQQACRLGVTPEKLAEMAVAYSGTPPSIATRCAVFAKSDIIHAQAAGYTPSGIAAGLCEGMARSIIASTTQGRELDGDLVFVGGVSRNMAIVKALEIQLGKKIHIPENPVYWGAMGAATMAGSSLSDLELLADFSKNRRNSRPPLSASAIDYPDFSEDSSIIANDVEITEYMAPDFAGGNVYLGIDVGSTSTKAVVTDSFDNVLLGVYTKTKANPVQATSEILARIGFFLKNRPVKIAGVATTGSGRELVKSVFNADMAINEITAHAKGACTIDPDVDTIIEIGGQDSKFTRLKNGAVTLAAMNYVCAAGTGSFIEEQANRLNIELDEIPALTMDKSAPFTSDRCTVYMERDLNTFLAEGWDRANVMAAVLFSVRDNYLSRVAGKTPFGECVFFQGATARNRALVAAFAAELGIKIKVSKFCHLTGALGCAVTARESGISESTFAGTDATCLVEAETCELCINRCKLSVYNVNGRKTAWGMKCGRDYNETECGRQQKTVSNLEKAFRKVMRPDYEKKTGGPTVAIPEVIYISEYGHLFESFLARLGFTIKIFSGSASALAEGGRKIQADFCAPMSMAHGVFLKAGESSADYIFFPTVINAPHESENFPELQPLSKKSEDRYFCYYSAYAPTILSSAVSAKKKSGIITPKIRFFRCTIDDIALRLANDISDLMKLDKSHVVEAFKAAWSDFEACRLAWQNLGKKKILSNQNKISIMLMARPYVLFDRRLNQGIPAKLESMGFDLVSQSMVHAPENNDKAMHWHYARQMAAALETVRDNPHIYPVFLSCFRCSPDAYLITEFKAEMERMRKPYLILQLDEHGSDVGYQTRIEAAVDTFSTHFSGKDKKHKFVPGSFHDAARLKSGANILNKDDVILLPYTDGKINRLQAAVFKSAGFDARVMNLEPGHIHLGYRFASGGECLPNVAILGSMIDTIKKDNIDPGHAVLYLPSLCIACNFPQYGRMIEHGLHHAGFHGARIFSFNGLESIPGLSMRTNTNLLAAANIGSILHKLVFRYRPYEAEAGTTDKVLAEAESVASDYIISRKSMIDVAKAVREIVGHLPLSEKRKPGIAVLGDLYAKYNDILNEKVCVLAENLGGEILIPSYNEMLVHAVYADAVENGTDTKAVSTLIKFEQKFEAVFRGILDDQFEPTPEECHRLTEKYGLEQPIPGETAISIARTLYYAEKGMISAIIHVNPVFCCPGVVSSAIFKNLQDRLGIPVIDLFYDGSNKPNNRIIPHLYYLAGKKNTHRDNAQYLS